jgi:hypothetical protein
MYAVQIEQLLKIWSKGTQIVKNAKVGKINELCVACVANGVLFKD